MLQTLEEGAFDDCKSLLDLFLQDNQLDSSQLHAINTANLIGLTALSLANNPLMDFPYLMLNNLLFLESLVLHGCKADSTDANAFVGLLYLENLDMSSNQLMSLKRETFQPLSEKLNILDISGNPMVCTCSVKEVKDWAVSSTVTLLSDPTCTSTHDGSTLHIVDDDLDFLCSENYTVPEPVCVTPMSCDNITITVTFTSEDEGVLVEWVVIGTQEASQVLLSCRQFGDDDMYEGLEVPPTGEKRMESAEEGDPLTCCVFVLECPVHSCADQTEDCGDNTGLIVLAVVSLVLLVGAVVALVIVIWYWRKSTLIRDDAQSAKRNYTSTPQLQTRPLPRQPSNDGTYEAIGDPYTITRFHDFQADNVDNANRAATTTNNVQNPSGTPEQKVRRFVRPQTQDPSNHSRNQPREVQSSKHSSQPTTASILNDGARPASGISQNTLIPDVVQGEANNDSGSHAANSHASPKLPPKQKHTSSPAQSRNVMSSGYHNVPDRGQSPSHCGRENQGLTLDNHDNGSYLTPTSQSASPETSQPHTSKDVVRNKPSLITTSTSFVRPNSATDSAVSTRPSSYKPARDTGYEDIAGSHI